MNVELVQRVWQRAFSRCEYCQIPASLYPLPFQIDHIIARQHGGVEDFENLALACIHCNRYKGPNIASIDAETNEIVRLFHPRRDVWSEHFRWNGSTIVGVTNIGRATSMLLNVNDQELVDLRAALMDEGVWPSASGAAASI